MPHKSHNTAPLAQAIEVLIKDNSDYVTDILERSGIEDPDIYPVSAKLFDEAPHHSRIVIADKHSNLYVLTVEPQ